MSGALNPDDVRFRTLVGSDNPKLLEPRNLLIVRAAGQFKPSIPPKQYAFIGRIINAVINLLSDSFFTRLKTKCSITGNPRGFRTTVVPLRTAYRFTSIFAASEALGRLNYHSTRFRLHFVITTSSNKSSITHNSWS